MKSISSVQPPANATTTSAILTAAADGDIEDMEDSLFTTVHHSLTVHEPSTAVIDEDDDDEGGDTSSGEYDPEYVESVERAEIVRKYELGSEAQTAEPWENPDFELYKTTDRHGFMHQTEVPDDDERARQKRIETLQRRERKWLQMLHRWPKFWGTMKLRERVWKGVPETVRSKAWLQIMGIDAVDNEGRSRRTYPPGVYEQLKARALLCAKDLRQIDLDINRTYRDHVMFRQRYDVKQQSLLHVLAAYSLYNVDIGYCQGMSQVAALLLMYLDEVDAFWTMHTLCVSTKHSMHGFFVPGFPKLHRFQNHFEYLLKKYEKRLKKHMDKQTVPPIFVTKWFFGCFLDRVPFSLALRLWDVYLLEGDVILTAMALNIMKMHSRALRRLQFEEILDVLQNKLGEDFGYDDETVMRSLDECVRTLRADNRARPPEPQPEADGQNPEQPRTPFGLILQRPLDDIRAEQIRIQSRRTSRASSVRNISGLQSQPPGTPKRQQQQQRELQAALNKISPSKSAVNGFPLPSDVSGTIEEEESDGGGMPRQPGSGRRLQAPHSIRVAPRSPPGQGHRQQQQQERVIPVTPTGQPAPPEHRQGLQRVPSLYDNVNPSDETGWGVEVAAAPGPSAPPSSSVVTHETSGAARVQHTEERRRFDRYTKPNGLLNMQTSLSRTVTQVETRPTDVQSPSCSSSSGRPTSAQHQQHIQMAAVSKQSRHFAQPLMQEQVVPSSLHRRPPADLVVDESPTFGQSRSPNYTATEYQHYQASQPQPHRTVAPPMIARMDRFDAEAFSSHLRGSTPDDYNSGTGMYVDVQHADNHVTHVRISPDSDHPSGGSDCIAPGLSRSAYRDRGSPASDNVKQTIV